MSPTRSMSACLKSVAEEAAPGFERPLRIAELVGEVVLDAAPHPHRSGFVLRFSSGEKLFIPTGVALDAAGLTVIEP